jgi:hypothetical protein
MMGGAAFASSPSGAADAVAQHGEAIQYTAPVNPGGVLGGACAVVVTTISNAGR